MGHPISGIGINRPTMGKIPPKASQINNIGNDQNFFTTTHRRQLDDLTYMESSYIPAKDHYQPNRSEHLNKFWLRTDKNNLHPLKLLSWNMAGWNNKTVDPEFFHYLHSYDILWLLKKNALILPGFKIWELPAQKSTKIGRDSGGLAILLSSTKGLEGKELTELQSTSWQVLIVYGCNPGPLICVNIYLPPRTNSLDPLIWTKLEDLLETILLTDPSLPVFLCGDFNTRMGSSNDTLKWTLGL